MLPSTEFSAVSIRDYSFGSLVTNFATQWKSAIECSRGYGQRIHANRLWAILTGDRDDSSHVHSECESGTNSSEASPGLSPQIIGRLSLHLLLQDLGLA